MTLHSRIDPRIGRDRAGLMLTRGQIEQAGKMIIYGQMLTDNSRNTIAYGSSEKFGVLGNPLTPDQKRRAIQGLWGPEAFDLLFLEDIGATDNLTDWADYVFGMAAEAGLPEPTDLYAGARNDARWYEQHFASISGAPSYRRGFFDVWENPKNGKCIHILDRETNIPISSSDVRAMIERRDPEWKNHVPAKLWDFYEWEYPGHLRVAVDIPAIEADRPGLESYPVGTKGSCVHGGRSEVLILRADSKWRPRSAAENGKSLGD